MQGLTIVYHNFIICTKMFFWKNVVNIFKVKSTLSGVWFLTDKSSSRSTFIFEGQNDQHVI